MHICNCMVASRSTRLVIYQIRTESLGTGARPVCCCIARWMYETKKPQLARAATTHMHHRHARTVRLQPAAACMHAHTVSMHACLAQHRPAAGRSYSGVVPEGLSCRYACRHPPVHVRRMCTRIARHPAYIQYVRFYYCTFQPSRSRVFNLIIHTIDHVLYCMQHAGPVLWWQHAFCNHIMCLDVTHGFGVGIKPT